MPSKLADIDPTLPFALRLVDNANALIKAATKVYGLKVEPSSLVKVVVSDFNIVIDFSPLKAAAGLIQGSPPTSEQARFVYELTSTMQDKVLTLQDVIQDLKDSLDDLEAAKTAIDAELGALSEVKIFTDKNPSGATIDLTLTSPQGLFSGSYANHPSISHFKMTKTPYDPDNVSHRVATIGFTGTPPDGIPPIPVLKDGWGQRSIGGTASFVWALGSWLFTITSTNTGGSNHSVTVTVSPPPEE